MWLHSRPQKPAPILSYTFEHCEKSFPCLKSQKPGHAYVVTKNMNTLPLPLPPFLVFLSFRFLLQKGNLEKAAEIF